MIDADAIARARSVPLEEELARRGVKLRGTIERVGPCPVCSGTDRFAINTRKQIWNCRGCSKGGDVIALVQHVDGLSFAEAIAVLAGASVARPQAKHQERVAPEPTRNNGEIALNIWKEAKDPRGTIVETYLAHRGLSLPDEAAGRAIRFHPACPFKAGCCTPAMIALVRDVITNEPKAIHRTALDEDGRKAWIDGDARLSLGPVAGGAVKLTANADVTLCLGIGEGIETTLSMHLVAEFGASPIWSLLSAGQIDRFPVLPNVETLWITVDRDHAGEHAAAVCAERWRQAGREVFLIKPRKAGDDLNDLAARRA